MVLSDMGFSKVECHDLLANVYVMLCLESRKPGGESSAHCTYKTLTHVLEKYTRSNRGGVRSANRNRNTPRMTLSSSEAIL